MEFSCSSCNYRSTLKSCVKSHINRKTRCGPDPQIIEIPIVIICEYCERSYKTRPSLKRHLKTCKVRKEHYEKTIAEKDQEIAVLKAKLESKPSVTNNNTTNINIQVNGFRDTDFSKLTDKHFQRALNRMLMSVPQLIEFTHFNRRLPENQNIYISNKKGKHAMVWNGREWELKNGQETIEQLINTHEYELEQWAEDKNQIEKYEKYLKIKDKEGAEESMMEEVKLLLYNKRNSISK